MHLLQKTQFSAAWFKTPTNSASHLFCNTVATTVDYSQFAGAMSVISEIHKALKSIISIFAESQEALDLSSSSRRGNRFDLRLLNRDTDVLLS